MKKPFKNNKTEGQYGSFTPVRWYHCIIPRVFGYPAVVFVNHLKSSAGCNKLTFMWNKLNIPTWSLKGKNSKDSSYTIKQLYIHRNEEQLLFVYDGCIKCQSSKASVKLCVIWIILKQVNPITLQANTKIVFIKIQTLKITLWRCHRLLWLNTFMSGLKRFNQDFEEGQTMWFSVCL